MISGFLTPDAERGGCAFRVKYAFLVAAIKLLTSVNFSVLHEFLVAVFLVCFLLLQTLKGSVVRITNPPPPNPTPVAIVVRRVLGFVFYLP